MKERQKERKKEGKKEGKKERERERKKKRSNNILNIKFKSHNYYVLKKNHNKNNFKSTF